MKKCFFPKIWLTIAIFLVILSQNQVLAVNDTIQKLYLKSIVQEKAKTVVATLWAENDSLFDFAAMQCVVGAPQWLELTTLVALKPDGSADGNKMSFLGTANQNNDLTTRMAAFFATAPTQPIQGKVPIARLTFNVGSGRVLLNKEEFVIFLDSIKVSTFNARPIQTDKFISLTIAVGDTTQDTSGHQNDDTLKVAERYRLKFSLKPATAAEGFDLTQGALKLKVNLEYRAIISQLQFSLIMPDTSWTIDAIETTDIEKKVFFNKVAGNKYKILFLGDTPEHPLLPDINNPEKTILILTLKPRQTPFGRQIFSLGEISAGSAYETEKLVANKDTSLAINLNKLFGTAIGKKGDLQFSDWLFGDSKIDSLDVDMMVQIIMEIIEPNDYQQWAADLDDDGDRDAVDLTELQKLIKISGVEENNAKENYRLTTNNKHLIFSGANNITVNLNLYSITGSLVGNFRLDSYQTIDLSKLSAGLYLYTGQLTTANGEKFVSGKILIIE